MTNTDIGIRGYWQGRRWGIPSISLFAHEVVAVQLADIAVVKNHGRFTHKILSITGGSLSMTEIKAAYKDVMGKQMPSVPSVLAWLILKLSAGARNVWVCARSSDQVTCADLDVGSWKSREITM